jgi:hypothetical protein
MPFIFIRGVLPAFYGAIKDMSILERADEATVRQRKRSVHGAVFTTLKPDMSVLWRAQIFWSSIFIPATPLL